MRQAREFLREHWFYLALQIISTAFVVWWIPYSRLPLPGYAVAGIAVLAAVMSVQPNMRSWQKFIWLLLIGAFLFTELRAIRKDRADSDAAALSDRKTQDQSFKAIRARQDSDFSATASDLTAAIQGIQSTLDAANKTIVQTRPYAAIRFDRFEFAGAPPTKIEANTEYTFNYYFVNMGAATATDISVLAKVYTGEADDKADQERIVREFENEWNKGGVLKSSTVIVPSYPLWNTVKRTFTSEELAKRNLTIYFLLRFEYSDINGRWRTDACSSFQKRPPTNLDVNVLHPCVVFQNFHYRVKQQR